MSTETTAKFGSLIKGVGLEIAEAFDQGKNSFMPGLNAIIHVESTDSLQTNYTDFTDFTGFGYTNEGDNAPEMKRHKGFDSKYVVDDFSGTIFVTKNSIDDNAYGDALRATTKNARAAMRFRDKLSFQLFNAGFDTNETEKNGYKLNWFGDNVPQFSVQHPSVVPDGSTQSNVSGTGITLTEDNLEIAQIALEDQTQDNGELLDFTGTKTVAVPHNLRRTARVILETENKVGSDFNDVNVYEGAFNLLVSQYFGLANGGSTTAWYMLDDTAHMLCFIDRETPYMEDDYNSRNKTYEYTIHARGTAASKGWKATWASKGDSATYTA